MVIENGEWKRPESVPFPSIWRRFKGRKEINGVIPSFWVQDITENEIETVTNCMLEQFCLDEPLTKYSELMKDPDSVEDMRTLWNAILRQKVGLICYMENPDPNGKPIFAAVNCTHVKTKYDKDVQVVGNVSKQVLATMGVVMKQIDAFEFLKTDALLSGLGLYVFPEFRGQGLGLEVLLAREALCKAVGITAAVTVFTSSISQILADKAKYENLTVISYNDLKVIHKLEYPGIEEKHKYLKYMYKVY